ncbi:Uncharacterised protein [Bordetella pertussis]|nr:Uncharacterised protein [Bordetella pertussis]
MPPSWRPWSSYRSRARRLNSAMIRSIRRRQSVLRSMTTKSSPPTWPTKSRRASQWRLMLSAHRRIMSSPRQ